MWLITTLVAALCATAAWTAAPKKYKLGFLCLMLWGASVMILVDHVIGYDGGKFIHMTTDGMITDGTVLGIAMLIPIFAVWEACVIFSMKKQEKQIKKGGK